ncbi:MAG: hypothetical protein PUD59_00075, partial [bacterium]|nr:hypothetical protein [bacterium]
KTKRILTNQTLSGTSYEKEFTVNRIAGNIINLSGEIFVNGKSVVTCNDSFEFSKNKTCKVESISIENTDDDKTIIKPKISSGNNLVAPNKYEIIDSSANMKCDNSGICTLSNFINSSATIRYLYDDIPCGEFKISGNVYKCTEKNKATEIDNIKDYCKNNWEKDKDNYESEEDCISRCGDGNNYCKSLTTIKEKKAWCNIKSNRDSVGYKKYEECVNDCAGGDIGEFLYRPISLGNAFPNREAGSNWIGYEEKTNKNVFNNDPKYVIILDSKTIEEIKQDTNGDKSKYVSFNSTKETGFYMSEFITKFDNIITSSYRNNGG